MAPLPKNVSIEYGDIPIKKLPDGKAFGADDLAHWSKRRALGYSGDGGTPTVAVKVKCSACGQVSEILVAKTAKGKQYKQAFDCRSCGKKKSRIQSKKQQRVDCAKGGRL